MHVNNPANTRRGGVGHFYKNSLSVVIRNDLSFDESIGRKNIFFTVLYRSPAFDHNSANFQAFLLNISNLYAKVKAILIPSIGGLMVIQLLKALKLNIFCHH